MMSIANVTGSTAPPPLRPPGEGASDGAAAVAVTSTDFCVEPLAFEQLNARLVEAITASDSEPAVAFAPLHPPEAVHVDAFVVDHVRSTLPPLITIAGLAVRFIVGSGGVTAMSMVRAVLTPELVHVRVNAVEESGATATEPAMGRAPVQPPLAVQPVAFVAFHVRVLLLPDTIEFGLALKLMTGGGGGAGETLTTTESLPLAPAPMQVSMNVDC
jgi:hypothetical protein